MRAYERFLEYVKVHTTSESDSMTHPTTMRQFDLAKMLVAEMKEIGMEEVRVDDKCYVYGVLPATKGYEQAKPLGFIAHMDTADSVSGENVKAQVIENYDGKDVLLAGNGSYLSVEQFPFLAKMKGQTLITADGTTLLGADDKAGIAEILTMAEQIITEQIPHGKICIAFTPDEEVGMGADFFDVEGFGAAYAYTVDGGDVGEIEYENFNAASAKVEFRGMNVHPGSAKNTMINAQNVAMEFHMALPKYERPEHTEGREGFYHLGDMYGDVNAATLDYIIRDHDAAKFAEKKETMQHVAAILNEKYGEQTVTVTIKDSYANMIEQIRPHFHLIESAREAVKKAGLVPMETPVRGGTDGARLSFMGLPCPNLGTGGFNFHGPAECITVEKMDQSVAVLLNLVEIYRDR